MQRIHISEEQLIEVQNILHGAFAPLTGFMDKRTVLSVLSDMQLPDGTTWPLPIVLDVAEPVEGELILTDPQGKDVAWMQVSESFHIDRDYFASHAFGTTDPNHPGVAQLHDMQPYFIGGRLEEIDCPYPTTTPAELKKRFAEMGWRRVVAFQTRNPPHRAHEYLQKCALETNDGLLVQPVQGKKKKGDFRDPVIMGAYETLLKHYFPQERAMLSPLPLTMRYAGPREAVLHAIVRRNFGCTHFIVGRDHAGVGDFYGPFEAQAIFDSLDDLGIEIMRMEHAVYCESCASFVTRKTCPHETHQKLSGTELRRKLLEKEPLSEEFMRKEVFDHITSHEHLFVE